MCEYFRRALCYLSSSILMYIISHKHMIVITDRSKSVNLDGSINNPAMHGNYKNVPIEMGSEWLYPSTELSRKHCCDLIIETFSLSHNISNILIL